MKILCVGDYIEDSYIFGTAFRLCPEAPVPVVIPQERRTSAGGVGLVANQLRELGADVTEWRGSFSRKERIFVGNHLVTRIDTDSIECFPDDFPKVDQFDAIVVSDYSKGAMSDELAQMLRFSRKPLFVDAKHHWGWYFGGSTTIFPNQVEADSDAYNPIAFGWVIRKLGENGACIDRTGLKVDATVKDVVDVTGAGDIFMAGYVYAWSLHHPAGHCLRFANEIAGESCRHRGTYVVPGEFSQSVLDRLLVSAKSEPRVLGSVHCSNQAETSHTTRYDPMNPIGVWTVSASDILRASSYVDQATIASLRKNLGFDKTPPESPLDPKPVSDVPIPEQIDKEPSSKPPWEG